MEKVSRLPRQSLQALAVRALKTIFSRVNLLREITRDYHQNHSEIITHRRITIENLVNDTPEIVTISDTKGGYHHVSIKVRDVIVATLSLYYQIIPRYNRAA